MLKRITMISTIVVVVLAFYIAAQYGEPQSTTFLEAVDRAGEYSDEAQAPKVLIVCSIVGIDNDRLLCEDRKATSFSVEYTGKPPNVPFTVGQTVRFVGHVHDGDQPYFHATQVFEQ